MLLTATAPEAAPLLAHLKTRRSSSWPARLLGTGRLRTAERRRGRADTRRWRSAGCDKANTAHLLTCLLQAMSPLPGLVLQVGIAGALPGPGRRLAASPGDVVIATEEIYSDTRQFEPEGWLSADELGLPVGNAMEGAHSGIRFTLDEDLVRTAVARRSSGPAASRWGRVAVIRSGRGSSAAVLTASRVTGLGAPRPRRWLERWGALAESMEGAAAAHVCALYGVPFLEVRGISNLVGDRDRASWQVERAVAVAAWAALAIVQRWIRCRRRGDFVRPTIERRHAAETRLRLAYLALPQRHVHLPCLGPGAAPRRSRRSS